MDKEELAENETDSQEGEMTLLKNFKMAPLFFISLLFYAAGCMHVSIGHMSVKVPVLMGPIERIGDSKPRRSRDRKETSFTGVVGVTAIGSGGVSKTTYGGVAVTDVRSASVSTWKNTLSAALDKAWKKAGGSYGNIFYFDDVRAQAWMQSYVFLMAGGVDMKVTGRVINKKGAGKLDSL